MELMRVVANDDDAVGNYLGNREEERNLKRKKLIYHSLLKVHFLNVCFHFLDFALLQKLRTQKQLLGFGLLANVLNGALSNTTRSWHKTWNINGCLLKL